MSPETPQTLLRKIAEFANGDDSAEWTRFVELYEPVIRHYVAAHGGVSESDIDDVVQDVFVKLVDVLRRGDYKREKGRFRSYLGTMVRRLLVDLHRRAVSRGEGRILPLDEKTAADDAMDAATIVDIRLRAARHAAAVEHVLSRTVLDAKTVAAYRAYVLEGRPAKEVAAAQGLAVNALRQLKYRLDRMISAVESAYGSQ
jgi:RNA polymerase sigma factor (sigma-70 family)